MPHRLKTKSSFLFTLRLPLPRSHRHPTPSPLSLPPHLPPFLHFMLLPSNSTFLPFSLSSPPLQCQTLPLSAHQHSSHQSRFYLAMDYFINPSFSSSTFLSSNQFLLD